MGLVVKIMQSHPLNVCLMLGNIVTVLLLTGKARCFWCGPFESVVGGPKSSSSSRPGVDDSIIGSVVFIAGNKGAACPGMTGFSCCLTSNR